MRMMMSDKLTAAQVIKLLENDPFDGITSINIDAIEDEELSSLVEQAWISFYSFSDDLDEVFNYAYSLADRSENDTSS